MSGEKLPRSSSGGRDNVALAMARALKQVFYENYVEAEQPDILSGPMVGLARDAEGYMVDVRVKRVEELERVPEYVPEGYEASFRFGIAPTDIRAFHASEISISHTSAMTN